MTRRAKLLTAAALTASAATGLLLARWSDVGILEDRIDAIASDVDAIARYQDDLARKLVERQDDLARKLVERQDDLARAVGEGLTR